MNDDLEQTLKKLPDLMKQREKELERREQELREQKARLEEEYPNHGQSDDVLDLSIGGTPVSVLRRTLTQVDGSMLASKFSGRWDETLTKDAKGKFFIDQNFCIFEPLLDYLRELSSQTELTKFPKSPVFDDDNLQRKFNTMVDYFGMTHGVFPISCYNYDQGQKLVANSSLKEISSSEKTTYWLMPTNDSHKRNVNSYEVSLGQHSTVQIGWAASSFMSECTQPRSDGHIGAGYTTNSVAFDSARGGMVLSSTFTECAGIEAKEGTVIRCEDKGSVWIFDGEAKVSYASFSDDGTEAIHDLTADGGYLLPCITVKGTFHISHIELEF
jgi:hypothetical protein